ncbi:hypothetical protein ACI2IX_19845 [Leifsonia aquatica]
MITTVMNNRPQGSMRGASLTTGSAAPLTATPAAFVACLAAGWGLAQLFG